MQNWWPQGQELSRPEGGHFQGLTAQLSRPRGCREVKGGCAVETSGFSAKALGNSVPRVTMSIQRFKGSGTP